MLEKLNRKDKVVHDCSYDAGIKNTSILKSITLLRLNYREQRKLKWNCSLTGLSETVLNGKAGEIWSLRRYRESWLLLVPLLQHLVTSFRPNLQVDIQTECSYHSKEICKPYVWIKGMEFLGFIINNSLLILLVFWKMGKFGFFCFVSQEVFFSVLTCSLAQCYWNKSNKHAIMKLLKQYFSKNFKYQLVWIP